MRRLILALAALLSAAGCSSSSAPNSPPSRPSDQLHVVVQDSTAPPLYSYNTTQLFTVGQNADVRLYYRDPTSGGYGDELLRFEVPGDGLFRRPDGTTFQTGDTVTITITVVDPKKMLFAFQPAGLQFNPNDPARLQIEYQHGDHDYNGDGVVNAADSTIQQQLDVWKNDPPSTTWFKQGGVNLESLEEIDVNILSFSQYAVAW